MSKLNITSIDIDEPAKIINLEADGSIFHNTVIEGTNNYEELENKPSIEGNTLIGDMSLTQLGITAGNLDITADSLGITPDGIGLKTAGASSIMSLFS